MEKKKELFCSISKLNQKKKKRKI